MPREKKEIRKQLKNRQLPNQRKRKGNTKMAKRQTITKPALQNLPSGMDLLDRPLLNKGTAFTEEERKKFGLHGLLPPEIEGLDQQLVRAYEAYKRKDDDLERHITCVRSRIRTKFF